MHSYICAIIAQSVERVLGKDEVPGSIPGVSSNKNIKDQLEEVDFFYDIFKI